MPEFLTLLPPEAARNLLFSHLPAPLSQAEWIQVVSSLGRVTAEDIIAPHPLPEFPRSTVDGYAVRASDTFGATDSLPAYFSLLGEVIMGDASSFELGLGQCALIHTGGMLPQGADAVVMLEHTQTAMRGAAQASTEEEIEVLRTVAAGENTIRIGEDVAPGTVVLQQGRVMRPAEMAALWPWGFSPCVWLAE